MGKTFTALAILRLLRAEGVRCVGMKPICCGDRADAESLLAAGSGEVTIDEINPVWLQTPAAPLTAAEIEGVRIEPSQLLAGLRELQARFDYVVVEGVGGWLVPIAENYFVSDLAGEMKAPVAIVARNRLGCLNHTMLTIRSVTAAGLKCAGIILNSLAGPDDIAEETNRSILERIATVPIVEGLSAETTGLSADWRELLAL